MISLSGISSAFRVSGADYDVEKDPDLFMGAATEYQKPAEPKSNLDRFRLMVGITTAPSMRARRRRSTASRIIQSGLPGNAQGNRNSVMPPEPAHVASSANPDPTVQPANGPESINSGSMPKNTAIEVDAISAPFRVANNAGIYETVVTKSTRARTSYKYASLIINVCLGLQIVVAAALTALGAAHNDNGGSVTALGAINTIIAGFLTYLKGSGLPGRLKYFQHEWEKVRDYIEARERDLRVNDNAFDVTDQVDYIRYMFDTVKKDIENNRADRFTSAGALHTMPESVDLQRIEKKRIVELGKRTINEIKNDIKETYSHHKDAAVNLEKQAERHVSVRDAVQALTAEAEEMKKRIHDSGDLQHFLSQVLKDKSVDKPPSEHRDETEK